LATQLKTENEALTKRVQHQPKLDEMGSENKDLKNKVHDLEKKMLDYQAVLKVYPLHLFLDF